MIRRIVCGAALASALVAPLAGQWIVFDPSNFENAVQQLLQLEAQLRQMVVTYEQIRTQYLLLKQQTQLLPVAMNAHASRA